ncbi:MAG TPA: FAD-dependent oxidoreductase [Vicinamibacteria bacterium]|jgi:NADPH-dependent 2,4-dienoyl-CoA reductase/sulfur reductase-like enzyme
MGERHLVVGGNAAGMTAASRAKRLVPSLDITIIEASQHISYSICGLPYWLGGRVPRFEDLVYFTPDSLQNERGINARLLTRALEILPARRSVLVEDLRRGEKETLKYDKLLIATGYKPISLDIEGAEAEGVFTVSRIEDGAAIADWLGPGRAKQAVLVGAGYVGLEMAEALRERGVGVTIIEKANGIFPAIDPDMATLLQSELEARGVRVLTGRTVERITTRSDGLVQGVELSGSRYHLPADLVLVDVGVEPRVDLVHGSDIRLGRSGAIAVSDRMETNVPMVYAAGNCAETVNMVTGRPTFAFLGTVAAKQGRVAGENMAGRLSHFRGAVGTTVVKVFGRVAARTGLATEEARREGFHVVDARVEGRFQASYFGGEPGTIKILADSETRRLLGAQIVGSEMACLRIDVLATALAARMTVDEAAQLDLAYAPPVGTLWSPVLTAMNVLMRRLERM